MNENYKRGKSCIIQQSFTITTHKAMFVEIDVCLDNAIPLHFSRNIKLYFLGSHVRMPNFYWHISIVTIDWSLVGSDI